MDDELIRIHGDLPELMPYLHLPVQSGSDRVLKAMNRKHTGEDYRRIIERVRQIRPDIAISSDFIAGFPGETDADFADTMKLVGDIGFAAAYSFKYSPRPGTPATGYDDPVSDPVSTARLHHLQDVLNRQQRAFNAATVGRTVDVLFEKKGKYPGQIAGRSPYLQAVQVDGPESLIGTVHPVTLTGTGNFSLFGTVVNSDPSGEMRVNTDGEVEQEGQATVTLQDNRLAGLVFGQYDQNVAHLERRLGIQASVNGNHVVLRGTKEATEQARRALKIIYAQVKSGRHVTTGDLDGAIAESALQGTLFPQAEGAKSGFEQIATRKRGPVKARNAAQSAYIRALNGHELVFAEGPAGTGKTWLAVGHAVQLLEQGKVERLILSVRRWKRAKGSGFCRGTCARKSILICARSMTPA